MHEAECGYGMSVYRLWAITTLMSLMNEIYRNQINVEQLITLSLIQLFPVVLSPFSLSLFRLASQFAFCQIETVKLLVYAWTNRVEHARNSIISAFICDRGKVSLPHILNDHRLLRLPFSAVRALCNKTYLSYEVVGVRKFAHREIESAFSECPKIHSDISILHESWVSWENTSWRDGWEWTQKNSSSSSGT